MVEIRIIIRENKKSKKMTIHMETLTGSDSIQSEEKVGNVLNEFVSLILKDIFKKTKEAQKIGKLPEVTK